VTESNRCALPGRVFWITGLSGAGKTTIGRRLSLQLRSSGAQVVFLDGDILRKVVSDDLGYTAEDRRSSATRNSLMCRMLAEQGIDVVCATISLFHDVQRWNRKNIPRYCEILVRAPWQELRQRDSKGIYAGTGQGQIANVVGIDVAAEMPEAPDLILDNDAALDPDEAVRLILDRISRAEAFGSPLNTAAVKFGTKAETLEQLAPLLRAATVLPQVRFSVDEWQRDRQGIMARIAAAPWGSGTLIARSSAKGEDASSNSQAGKYTSVSGVRGPAAVAGGIEKVIASFDENKCVDDQIFIQPMLTEISIAGVAATCAPNSGGPYFVINYDDDSGRTDLVTSGTGEALKTFYCLKSQHDDIPEHLRSILDLLRELEALLQCSTLDVEFAVDKNDKLYLLQVRPLTADRPSVTAEQIDAAVQEIVCKLALLSRPHPYLHGNRSVFGVMPDWNPAEIIGLKPRRLALSLYRELVTDAIWAYQRNNYGYKNLRSFPLMVNFHGLPYIDVRVSFNSFLPRDINADLAERLVNYYIDRLLAQPTLHDKVEFEIIFSCYTLDLPERLSALSNHGFSPDDIASIAEALRHTTNKIINEDNGLWRGDRKKVDILVQRLPTVRDAALDKISRLYWLIEDCKRYGTLPFAGLARAGFIATQLLQSLLATGVIDASEYAAFMANLDTVASQMGRDFRHLTREEFLTRYGHLRPGTYDILSPRYDEAADLYFDWAAPRPRESAAPRFALSVNQLRQIKRLLTEHGIEHDVLSFINFIKEGIEGREYAKFVFTRSLSDALSLVKKIGEEHGLSNEDCAFLDIADLRALYAESGCVKARLKESVAEGRRRHDFTRQIVMAPLVSSPKDAFSFHLPSTHPNYITDKRVIGPVTTIADSPESFKGSILFVPSADPGFDWIFSRGISGFVTQFGGVNSHMAIRAGELAIPAVIGAGETLFQLWKRAQKVCLDCGNRQVQVVS
jgi:adenylylsulfate kinase-like enzyme/phosphohistidine swiveling domain-containing protein